MTSLKNQRRLAAKLLKIGENRVWIDADRTDDVEAAITRDEIRKLIHEGAIKTRPETGTSRARARVLHNKRRKGRRSGFGSRSASPRARLTKKKAWMLRVRALRKRLRFLKTKKTITEGAYREIYKIASSGRFESIADLERYLKTHELWRKR